MSSRNFNIHGTRSRYGTVTIRKETKCGMAYTIIQLHQTDIVTRQNVNNIVELNTGGWYTVTTKEAMNHALRQIYGMNAPSVYQSKKVWYIQFKDGIVVKYQDKMLISEFKVLNPTMLHKLVV